MPLFANKGVMEEPLPEEFQAIIEEDLQLVELEINPSWRTIWENVAVNDRPCKNIFHNGIITKGFFTWLMDRIDNDGLQIIRRDKIPETCQKILDQKRLNNEQALEKVDLSLVAKLKEDLERETKISNDLLDQIKELKEQASFSIEEKIEGELLGWKSECERLESLVKGMYNIMNNTMNFFEVKELEDFINDMIYRGHESIDPDAILKKIDELKKKNPLNEEGMKIIREVREL